MEDKMSENLSEEQAKEALESGYAAIWGPIKR